MFKFSLLLICLCCFVGCFAQKNYTSEKTAKPKVLEAFRKGQRLAFNGQLDAAAAELEKLLRADPTFIDAQIELANVKNQQGRYAEAELGYEKALAIDPTYLPSLLYSLAIVEFDQEKFEDATAHFQQFLDSGKATDKRKATAEKYLANAKFAAEALRNPVPYLPANLGPAINTADHEYLPTLTADGQKLIFTAMRGRQEDFFISQKKDGVWQQAQPIPAVNSQYNEGAQSISADGKLLVFTICNRPGSLGRCDLYFSEFVQGKWTPVQNMGAPVNSPDYESLPSISANGRSLYFTSDRKGGLGGLDIWVSHRQTDGKWGQPLNLGQPVNTASDEQAPFLHPDGQTLYFMSKGHPGMGEYDLFLSKMAPDGKWATPQNLGYPINTKGNEGAFTVSLDGRTAYFSSDMKGGHGLTDIYSFDLHEAARPSPVTYVKAIVTDGVKRTKLAAKVEFVDLGTGQVFLTSVTDADGEFLVTLPIGKDYALHVTKEKYLFHSENFALQDLASLEKPFELNIELQPLPESLDGMAVIPSKPIVLKNVFFQTGSADLKEESLSELRSLLKLLEGNPHLRIQINGHTDNVGTAMDNMLLSENRAKAVYDFLVKNNIPAQRLKYKGFGENMPIATNDTEEGRKENRRTEFVLINQ